MSYLPLTDAEMERMKQSMIDALRGCSLLVQRDNTTLALLLAMGISRSRIAPTPRECRERGAACFSGPGRDCRLWALHYFIIAIRRWREYQPV